MIVYVKPIPTKQVWHGVQDEEQIQHFTQPKQYEVLYNSQTGKYDTGLTDKEQEKFEKELGINLNPVFQPDKPHPFFSTRQARIVLPYRTETFNTENALQNLKVHFMKKSPFIANSWREWEEGIWPEATHYIYDEKAETEVEATKIEKRDKCVAASLKLSTEDKRNIVRVLSDKTVVKMSDNYVTVELDKCINRNPEEFLRLCTMDKKELGIRAILLEAIQKNILIKEGLAYTYMGERLAGDFEEMVQWFEDPQNQLQKTKILEKLQS